MPARTVQLLQTLPPDLRERGWTVLVPSTDGPRYRAVYVRPFVDHLDRLDMSWPLYDKRTRRQILRISTHQDRSPTWEDARQDAIRRVREVDARVRGVT